MTRPILLGIAGGSGSGKSWLAERLRSHFGAQTLSLLQQDWYYRDLSHLAPETAAKTDFDHPEAIEFPLLLAQLDHLAAGRPIEAPQYDFARFSRQAETRTIAPAPLVAVEGLFTLHLPELAQRFDLSVFVDTPADIRLLRRIRRDLQERGYPLERILEFWERDQFPSFAQFVLPQRSRAALVWESLQDSAFVPAFLADLQSRLASNADPPTQQG